tara:strand:+ start:18370 stop:18507 length:138 start_codon:yes stop_codon:yes gene_type:complete
MTVGIFRGTCSAYFSSEIAYNPKGEIFYFPRGDFDYNIVTALSRA